MLFRFGNCELDTDRRILRRDRSEVAVEPQVFDLIRLLAENPDRLVSRNEIVEAVWQGRIVSESAISARIASARKAVGDDGQRQAVIRTAQRRGLQMAVPVRADAPTTDRAAEAPLRVRYTMNDQGKSIAYAVSGSGPRLLRIAAPPVDMEMELAIPAIRAFQRQIEQRFTYLRYDLVGYGLSERDDALEDIALEAEDARAVADAAGWDCFSVFSESGSSLVAVHLAARYPERVEKLVMLGGYAEGRSVRAGGEGPDVYRAMLAEGWSEPGGALANAFMLAYFPEGPLEDVRGMTRMMQVAGSHRKMLATRDAVNNAAVVDLLPKVRCPTLMVHGRHDAVHPLSQARKLAAGIADAQLLVLETANHLPLPSHPTWDTFMAGFTEFLAR